MTAPDHTLAARLELHDDGATSGKWGQYNPRFMDEAKDAEMKDWDTSHGLSAVHNGQRKRIAEWKHADDAAFAEMLVNAYRSGQLITLSDHTAAVQAAVAKAVEAERLQCARRANRVPLFGNSSAEQHASLEMACAIRDAILPDADFMAMCKDEAAIRARKGDAL